MAERMKLAKAGLGSFPLETPGGLISFPFAAGSSPFPQDPEGCLAHPRARFHEVGPALARLDVLIPFVRCHFQLGNTFLIDCPSDSNLRRERLLFLAVARK